MMPISELSEFRGRNRVWNELSVDGRMKIFVPKSMLTVGSNTVTFKAYDNADHISEETDDL
jgi:hypothetical protein